MTALALAATAVYAPLFDGMAPLALDGRARAGTPAPRQVWLVSVDGFAPRLLEAAQAPALERLRRAAATAARAATVVPSITLAAHATMLTGLAPEAHGVGWNRYQPWSEIGAPTLFDACRAEGLRCGLFAGKRKFAHFAESEPGVARYRFAPDAEGVLREALAWAREDDPDFALVHLAEVDLAGHAEGWGSAPQLEALRELGERLEAFVEALRQASARPVVVLLTADHGGHATRHGTDSPEDMAIPWWLLGDGIPAGAALGAASALDTAPTVMALLGLEPPAAWPGRARLPDAVTLAAETDAPGR